MTHSSAAIAPTAIPIANARIPTSSRLTPMTPPSRDPVYAVQAVRHRSVNVSFPWRPKPRLGPATYLRTSGTARPTSRSAERPTDMPIRFRALAAPLLVVAVVAACSSTGSSPAAATQTPATQAPASVAPASPAASAAASGAAASGVTVEAKPVGSLGTVLVAGSNGMTVYT